MLNSDLFYLILGVLAGFGVQLFYDFFGDIFSSLKSLSALDKAFIKLGLGTLVIAILGVGVWLLSR